MREILFRGQTRRYGEKVKLNGEKIKSNWVYGGIFPQNKGGDFAIIYQQKPTIEKYPVYADTVGQYTGMLDKNGTKIFEGDIVDFPNRSDSESYGVVKYDINETEFAIVYDSIYTGLGRQYHSRDIEIIGNIYDNPELLTGEIKKEINAVTDSTTAKVTDKEMELINAYSRRKLTKDEVYVFGVVLCDNDIDRDNERFTVESLFELEKLFVGKTGIFDHSPTVQNQTARIFACSVESVDGRKTAMGDDYFRLTARAYIPKTKGNDEIIQAIDSGILKEVSIGCAAGEVKCSVCGESLNHCSHIKGETYGGRKCYGELCGIYDAYEWSFVTSAGVIKSFKGKEMRV